jgi:ribonuclease VapC
MILDTSVIVAMVLREPGYPALAEKIDQAPLVAVPATAVFEAAMVLTIKLKTDGLSLVNELLVESGVTVLSFTHEHSSRAFGAFLRYGKGRHPARLNFGDCLSYAAAKVSGQPLLFVGDDFAQTDVLAA